MTECERIIEQGILPKSFFEEEVRCDFLVTKERKKVWAVLLDMMLKFDEVCKHHGLQYFLGGGTLLGAVRHKGFIPWDDDIDINMKREDYEKLLILQDEFKVPYFLQNPDTDPEAFYSYSRLVNINTTAFSRMFAWQDMKHGLFIDVFPMDSWKEEDEERFEQIKALSRENSTYMRMKNPYLSEDDKLRVSNWSGTPPYAVYKEIQEIAQRDNNVETPCLMAGVITNYSFQKKLRPKQAYEKAVSYEFEGFHFLGPEKADEVLRGQYGDYMQLPPIDKRAKAGVWHENAIFNPDIPYTEYMKTYRNK